MLYDQAMLLWVYSLAYKVIGKEEYKIIIEKIIKCLEETFENNGLYYSAHDADTDHEEGKTYLWTKPELRKFLGDQFETFSNLYEIADEGNFEGKIHLIKKTDKFLSGIENKLLDHRKKRVQPFVDKKIITSWNSLVGIALLMAYRFVGIEKAKSKALRIFDMLVSKHYRDGKLYRSSLGGELQRHEFLEDYAGFLLFATHIYEETMEGEKFIKDLLEKLEKFRKNNTWIENIGKDFIETPAQKFDHPIPSSYSLAEFACLRAKIILGMDYHEERQINYGSDFYNFMIFFSENYHILKTPEKIDWSRLTINFMQLPSKDGKIQDCYGKVCNIYHNIEELIEKIKEKN